MSFPTRERGLKSYTCLHAPMGGFVVPHAGTWIEMWMNLSSRLSRTVVPHAGTWIEIDGRDAYDDYMTVVPHAGTWIEMSIPCAGVRAYEVVPHAGTWIEMKETGSTYVISWSFPTRERGLKFCFRNTVVHSSQSFPTRERGLKSRATTAPYVIEFVVPHAGPWIEIKIALTDI